MDTQEQVEKRESLTPKLLPCPFCLGDNVSSKKDTCAYLPQCAWIVYCKSCGANGGNCPDEYAAMKLWNIRPDNERAELIAALKDSALAAHSVGGYHHPSWVTFQKCKKKICEEARALLDKADKQ